jgi:Ca2+-binding RTX toxin-like protein
MDRLNGGRGRDFLAGGRGRDKMIGGAGLDTYNGGAGNDLINAAGGKGDRGDRIDCGPGRDVVWLDRYDSTTRCERKLHG